MNIKILEKIPLTFCTLREIKKHLRITHDLEDSIIEGCLESAVEWIENYTGQAIEKKQIEFTIPFSKKNREKIGLSMKLWNSSGRSLFFFPFFPLIELNEVSIILADGILQTIPDKKIHLNHVENTSFIIIDDSKGLGFRIQCWIGHKDEKLIPSLLKQSIFQAVACLYENRGNIQSSYLESSCGGLLKSFRFNRPFL